MEHFSLKLEDTERIASELAQDLRPGDIVLLKGNLGAGKTTMTKAIAKALGVTEEVTSPTFGLMHVYPAQNNQDITQVIHIDTYRLESEEDLIDIAAEDYVGQNRNVSIIEWPEKISNFLAGKQTKMVEIELQDGNTRKITIQK